MDKYKEVDFSKPLSSERIDPIKSLVESGDLKELSLTDLVQMFINHFEYFGNLSREQQYNWVQAFAAYTGHEPKEGWVDFKDLRKLED